MKHIKLFEEWKPVGEFDKTKFTKSELDALPNPQILRAAITGEKDPLYKLTLDNKAIIRYFDGKGTRHFLEPLNNLSAKEILNTYKSLYKKLDKGRAAEEWIIKNTKLIRKSFNMK